MGTRADNNEGSCREILSGRHKGKWRVQFTTTDSTGVRRRLSRIKSTKTEARALLQQLRRGEVQVAARTARELTLSEWFHWLAENDWPENLAQVTIAQRLSRFRNYVERDLGDRHLSKIDALHVRAFYRRLRENGVTDSLVLSIKGDLVRTFNQASIPYQRVAPSIANPFRLPLQQPTPRVAVALTPEEVLGALARPSLDKSRRALLGLFLLGGLRLGEVMAITRGQLRLDEGLIVVDRAVQVAFGGKQSIGLPKGGKTRNVVMCALLKKLLTDHAQVLEPGALLWPAASENKPRMKKLFYSTWRSILKDALLPQEMSPHDCRLTHINLIEKMMPSVSVTTLKEHVGHAATGVTEANYTRPISSSQTILQRELDRVFTVS